MKATKADLGRILEALESLQQEVGRLNERLARLEAVSPADAAPTPTVAAPAAQEVHGIDPQTAMVIAAAIAAYLGKKPSIRQIRLLGSGAWAQQGRVSIQASYAVSANPH